MVQRWRNLISILYMESLLTVIIRIWIFGGSSGLESQQQFKDNNVEKCNIPNLIVLICILLEACSWLATNLCYGINYNPIALRNDDFKIYEFCLGKQYYLHMENNSIHEPTNSGYHSVQTHHIHELA